MYINTYPYTGEKKGERVVEVWLFKAKVCKESKKLRNFRAAGTR